jgi:hypothetical protein
MRVVVAGYLVRFPLGGYAWQALHFLAGFRALGCDTFFYEDTAYYDEAYVPGVGMERSGFGYGRDFTARFLGAHGFGDAWAFHDVAADRWYGAGRERAAAALAGADLVVNVAGVNRIARERLGRARTVFVDLDPAYTQLRLAGGDRGLHDLIAAHDRHFTFGESIGTAGCRIPSGGFAWRPLRQPIVASLWSPVGDADAFTTVGKWDSGGRDVAFAGEVFTWRKRTEWLKILELPRRTGQRFRIAMDVASRPDDLRRLGDAGWEVIDPLAVSADPEAYRRFIAGSKAELTVAKDVNVRLASGWFSDRAACYLAAARPVVTQDTGFGRHFPAGDGVLAFTDLEGAVAAVERVVADYAHHSRAARALALEHFSPERVLAPMLTDIA